MTACPNAPQSTKPPRPDIPQAVIEGALAVWRDAEQQHTFRIAGSSMWPILRAGDVARVAHGLGGLRRGEILVFRRGGMLIAHRVLRWTQDADGLAIETKGDNVFAWDAPVRPAEVVGRVRVIEGPERSIRLDTGPGHAWGWLIATGTLVGLAALRGGRTVQRLGWGDRPCRLTHTLHAAARRGFAGFLWLARWALDGRAERPGSASK